jgi:hypothetical protein
MSQSVIFPEAGIFYGVCWIVVILRLISRRLHRGSWKQLQLDDYLILLAMATDTVLIAIMSQVVQTSSNLIPPGEDVSKYSQAEIDSRIYGSKLVLIVEQMQILTIWLIKTCLLLLYNRMTTILPQHTIVVATSIYVAVAFVCSSFLPQIGNSNLVTRSSWKFCTLACGAGPSISIGRCLQIRVSL